MKTAIVAILMFCALIFLHELGHFMAAKACGVKVNKFALGMGPAILKRKKGETEYSLRIFPIGGFCEMEGENGDLESDLEKEDRGDAEEAESGIRENGASIKAEEMLEYISAEEDEYENESEDPDAPCSEEKVSVSKNPRAFCNKKAWQKIVILFAGPAMNVITALILMAVVLFYMGTATTTVNKVVDDSPALEAGIQAGDKLVSIDGKSIDQWEDVSDAVAAADSDELEVIVDRDGKEVTLNCGLMEESGRKILGIEPERQHSAVKAIVQAPGYTWDITKQMYSAIKQIVTGELSTDELSGPVGIVYLVNESAKAGIINVLYLAALLSLNLGIFNLLPFPALDGGRIVFVAIRKVTGKLISDKVEAYVNAAGMLCLLALMVYVTWNDILKFIAPLF